MARDPICGMEVDPASTFASREHMNQRFYFCSQQCVETFDANPHQYAHAVSHANHHNGASSDGHVQPSAVSTRIELAVVSLPNRVHAQR